MKEGVIFGLKSPGDPTSSLVIAPRNAFPMKTVAVDSESIVPAFASGIFF